MRQIMDSCFPCMEQQEENPTGSYMEDLGDLIPLIPKEEPMETENEEPTGSSQLEHEEKPILDECLVCGFRCLQSERLEQHWSHVALEHLETPGIFGCSGCQRTWDTTKPFREHLLTHSLWQDASLLDLRDLDAYNTFQICFGMSKERLEEAGLKHLFQLEVELLPPPRTQDKQFKLQTTFALQGKILDQCLLCGYEFMCSQCPTERSRRRWRHLAICHLENPHVFTCSVCQKGFLWANNFKRHVVENHPKENSATSRMLLQDRRTANDWQLYHTCFGAKKNIETAMPNPKTHPPPPRPPKIKQTKAKFKKSCTLCGYQLPTCRYRGQESLLRWSHVSQEHADGKHLFYCPLCKKGGKQIGAVTYFCKRNHPGRKVEVDNRKELNELHRRCFLIASKTA